MQQPMQEIDRGGDRLFQPIDPRFEMIEMLVERRAVGAGGKMVLGRIDDRDRGKRRLRADFFTNLARDHLHVARTNGVLLAEIGGEQ